MKDQREETAEKLAEVYKQWVSHAGEKKLNMNDIHLGAYLHIAFNGGDNVKDIRTEAL